MKQGTGESGGGWTKELNLGKVLGKVMVQDGVLRETEHTK